MQASHLRAQWRLSDRTREPLIYRHEQLFRVRTSCCCALQCTLLDEVNLCGLIFKPLTGRADQIGAFLV